jgi:molybdopterin converting factor small subunit
VTAAVGAVTVEITSWATRLVGGDGAGRRVFEEPLEPGATVRSILARVSARYPELDGALWKGRELGEHLEVLVNDAVLGVEHELDSPLAPGDRIALLPQFSGGADV